MNDLFNPDRYSISVRLEDTEDGDLYVGSVAELPDVETYGDTFDEAREMLLEAIIDLKDMSAELGHVFPSPLEKTTDDYSGRITLRIPKRLHAETARIARAEGVSINHFISTTLTAGVAVRGFYDSIQTPKIQSRMTVFFKTQKSLIKNFYSIAAVAEGDQLSTPIPRLVPTGTDEILADEEVELYG
jgi:predicted HicB family RNase H-like nuclease